MTATTTQIGLCGTCGDPTQADVRAGCTPHTCTTPCRTCGHPGDVHKTWYGPPGFCRRCPLDQDNRNHAYQPADRATEK